MRELAKFRDLESKDILKTKSACTSNSANLREVGVAPSGRKINTKMSKLE